MARRGTCLLGAVPAGLHVAGARIGLDLMLTWIVLHRGGCEVNVVAESVIDRFGLLGLAAFKFALVVLVICLCEVIGRRSPSAGRGLATAGVVITCMPVATATFLLLTR